MEIKGQAVLLRIFVGESDKVGHLPLYEAIVRNARDSGLAGATVLKGVLGYGATHHIHRRDPSVKNWSSSRLLRFSNGNMAIERVSAGAVSADCIHSSGHLVLHLRAELAVQSPRVPGPKIAFARQNSLTPE